MAKMTLKKALELLKVNHGDVSLEDLEDDELGLSIPELRKRLKENQEGYTKATQKAAEMQKQLEGAAGQIQQLTQAYNAVQAQAANLNARATATAGEDWRTDPLYKPVADYMGRLENALTQMAQGYTALVGQYNTDRQYMSGIVRDLLIDRARTKHGDFPVDEVEAVAKELQIDNWEGAALAWKGRNAGKLQEQAVIAEREKVHKELNDKAGVPPVTEMSNAPPAPQVGGEKLPDYDKAWAEVLVPQFKAMGVGPTR